MCNKKVVKNIKQRNKEYKRVIKTNKYVTKSGER